MPEYKDLEVMHLPDTGIHMTRRRAVMTVLIAAALLLLLLGLRFLMSRTDCGTPEGRIQFLSRLGWEAAADSETHQTLILPAELSEVLEAYNRMQLKQGYDLKRHLGERCEVYTYRVTNYPDCGQTVLATLYIHGRRVIAGDIHSTALDGFMHGIKRD